MPGVYQRKSHCPTVAYLDIFPDHCDLIKPHIEHESTIKPCQHLKTETLHSGKYLELSRYVFRDSSRNVRSAEGVHMINNAIDVKPKVPDAPVLPLKLGNLCTIAVLKKQILCDSLVLTKQYRAPLGAYTIEFPATVSILHSLKIDSLTHSHPIHQVLESGPMSPSDLATREIQDDTGYSSSSVQYISPLTSLEPDISDGKLQFVSMTIDGDDPLQSTTCDNNNQSNDGNTGSHGDIVEVLKIPINSLLDRLEKYDEQGYVIDSRVIAFAIGLQRGQMLNATETRVENESSM